MDPLNFSRRTFYLLFFSSCNLSQSRSVQYQRLLSNGSPESEQFSDYYRASNQSSASSLCSLPLEEGERPVNRILTKKPMGHNIIIIFNYRCVMAGTGYENSSTFLPRASQSKLPSRPFSSSLSSSSRSP